MTMTASMLLARLRSAGVALWIEEWDGELFVNLANQRRQLLRSLAGERSSWPRSLRASVSAALAALAARLAPDRPASIEPPVACVCYID